MHPLRAKVAPHPLRPWLRPERSCAAAVRDRRQEFHPNAKRLGDRREPCPVRIEPGLEGALFYGILGCLPTALLGAVVGGVVGAGRAMGENEKEEHSR